MKDWFDICTNPKLLGTIACKGLELSLLGATFVVRATREKYNDCLEFNPYGRAPPRTSAAPCAHSIYLYTQFINVVMLSLCLRCIRCDGHVTGPLSVEHPGASGQCGSASFCTNSLCACVALGVMVMWQGHPVWSTLALQDSVALHHFAQRALLPQVLGGKVGTQEWHRGCECVRACVQDWPES